MYVNIIYKVQITVQMWEEIISAIIMTFHNSYLTNNSQKEQNV